MLVARCHLCFVLLLIMLLLFCVQSIHMGDLELFSEGLRTIADVLMGTEEEESSGPPSPDNLTQSEVTIFGLICLISSAGERLKSSEISKEQHARLLSATFSRDPSVEMVVFALFRTPLYHRLVMESKEKAKIGKSIIFHCLRILTPWESTRILLPQQEGGHVGRCEDSRSSRHTCNQVIMGQQDQGRGAPESTDPSFALHPITRRVLANRPDLSSTLTGQVDTNAANKSIGIDSQGWPFEGCLMNGGGSSVKEGFIVSIILCWIDDGI